MIASKHVRYAATDQGVVFMNVANGAIFQSNPIGRMIWTRIKEDTPVSVIVDEIVERYGASRQEVDRDVHGYIEALKSNGLIVEK
ncbi:MAG: PqqD family protein [Candidatus Acidiferrales bacterium]